MSNLICIDPGHGGMDPGGGSNSSFLEKDMVLQISFEQKRHFERNGIKVYMTRTNDEYLKSGPRTARVRSSGAKHCISNHVNAFNGKAKGAETIHSIYANKRTAEGILNALVAEGAHRRRVFSKEGRNGDFYYMHRLTGSVSTVIIEYGFADHPDDSVKIIRDWKKYAEAVARYYIENVFNKKYRPAIGGSAPSTTKPLAKELYRVRSSWGDAKSQKGAYAVLRNAQATADRHKGYKVYNKVGTVVYNPRGGNYKPAPNKPKPKPANNKDPIVNGIQKWVGTPADGIAGKDTWRRLTIKYQSELNSQFNRGLIVDGIAGRKTFAAGVNVRYGARGNLTRVLQSALYLKGYTEVGKPDGIFLGNTKKALDKFQRDQGLAVDTIAGKNTFSRLFA